MKSLSELVGETLYFYQPSIWKSYYELKHGDNVLELLVFQNFSEPGLCLKWKTKVGKFIVRISGSRK